MKEDKLLTELIIRRKQSDNPVFGTVQREIITDRDVFPYQRIWRGHYMSELPIVEGRRAGWRPVNNQCYIYQGCDKPDIPPPNHCFQAPCSTVFPCYRSCVQTENARKIMMNNMYIDEYR